MVQFLKKEKVNKANIFDGKVALVTDSVSGLSKALVLDLILQEPSVVAGSRAAKPAELAAVITFLASDEAGFVNGAILAAGNGWSAV